MPAKNAANDAATRPTVVLGISGSIAAYKAVEVARLLVKAGVVVLPVMTDAAQRFVGATTLAGVCGQPVRADMWSSPGEPHVSLGSEADVLALVPATAELLGALAHGRADDLLRATAMCARGPVVAAPAMHPRMWNHPATQQNIETLRRHGRVALVGPVEGEVASGEVGMGRMAEPAEIAAAIMAQLGPRDLEGVRVLVSAGPTVEDIDPARFLSNRSSGKMGYAVAERAAARGARVTLISGPVSLNTPHNVKRVDVRSARDMKVALWDALGDDFSNIDALVMTAAVADFRPLDPSNKKLKRAEMGQNPSIELAANPDLIAEIGAARQAARPYLVAFALETVKGKALVDAARGKLSGKSVDMVVANHADDAFDSEDNVATLVTRDEAESLPLLAKRDVADRILDRVARAIAEGA
jgi:phosphopantothenoylcysteine decarboxylase/phosphopantothenate--cysteine ligase